MATKEVFLFLIITSFVESFRGALSPIWRATSSRFCDPLWRNRIRITDITPLSPIPPAYKDSCERKAGLFMSVPGESSSYVDLIFYVVFFYIL